MFKDLYFKLLEQLGQHTKQKRVKLKIKVPVYLLDSTSHFPVSLFDWATYRTKKGAVKMHTLLEYDGKLPVLWNITKGSVADNKGAENIPLWKREQSLLQTDSITIFQCSLFGDSKGVSS